MTPLKRRPRPREATDFTQITQKANSGTRFGPDWGAACSLDARVSGGPASPIQVSRGCLAVPGALCSQLLSQVHLPQTAGNFCPLSSLSASTTPCPPPWGSVLNQRERSRPTIRPHKTRTPVSFISELEEVLGLAQPPKFV